MNESVNEWLFEREIKKDFKNIKERMKERTNNEST